MSEMPSVWKTTIGLLTVTCATFGLSSCFFSFSRVMIKAGFWALSIYFLSNTFLAGQGSAGDFSIAKSFPKVLPGGLVYDSIPDASDSIIRTGFKMPAAGGILNTLYNYVGEPAEQITTALNIKSLGLGSTGFSDMKFNSGVLPDSVYFPKNNVKRDFYPSGKSSGGGLSDIMNLLAVAK